MRYNIALKTDIGIRKETNQDSICLRLGETEKGIIAFAIICDGMGGLEKGEVASASVITAFAKWFEKDLPYLLAKENYFEEIRYKWERIIKEQNQNIVEYGRKYHIQLGTTLTAMLINEAGQYIIGHVGDCRAYKITNETIKVLTEDQTVVAREVKQGKMTPEQALTDPRKNVLLQCIGASKVVEPDFVYGDVMSNECYMLCSDGFRHVISEEEIKSAFCPSNNTDEKMMEDNIVRAIEVVKQREETDNISVILLKTI